ncbi:methylated-DNA--[protein]-cysteine S-methyltransferase [Salinactinospora qingdaonensis]|uniref:Methylated-DNA--[protein]-cysteine S-methyltransferase n=1 Tax=Salinactinospora qingdaonensis TaxID=702744 RepID=A0ABP7FAZ3_9ACTN
MIEATIIDTPLGPLSLLAREGRCVGAGFSRDPGELYRHLHPSLRDPMTDVTDLGSVTAAVHRYFAGDVDAFDEVAVLQPSSPARERLWQAMRSVPAGATISYGRLAQAAGLTTAGARAAGGACAANLVAPIVPCHRVVAADGGLHHYGYGVAAKEWLLRHEGSML